MLQAESEVAQAGKAVALYFEEKLKEIYGDQNFPPHPDTEPEEDEEVTEDSDDDFVQPRRKRLKSEEKPLHIKWDFKDTFQGAKEDPQWSADLFERGR